MGNDQSGVPVTTESSSDPAAREQRGESSPGLPDLPKLPDHVRMTGWNTAVVDLRPWGQGEVHIADAPAGRLTAYDDFHDGNGRRPLFSGTARLLRSFCREFRGMVGPKWGAPLEGTNGTSWQEWLNDFESRPLLALVEAVFAFRERLAASDNRRGN